MADSINKVVLAYSGGLDTSIILKWLQDEYHCEVVTFTADIGQGEVAAIGDMPVEIQVQRPYPHAYHGGGQAMGRLAPGATAEHVEQSKPEIHRDATELNSGSTVRAPNRLR